MEGITPLPGKDSCLRVYGGGFPPMQAGCLACSSASQEFDRTISMSTSFTGNVDHCAYIAQLMVEPFGVILGESQAQQGSRAARQGWRVLLIEERLQERLRADEKPDGRDNHSAETGEPRDHPRAELGVLRGCVETAAIPDSRSVGVCRRKHHADIFFAISGAVQRADYVRESDVSGIHTVSGCCIHTHDSDPPVRLMEDESTAS
jgi:hypothetical protein